MNTRIKTRIFAAALCGLVGSVGGHARQVPEPKQTESATSDEERDQLLAKGKAIFVEKCAKCHNERGDKALSSGKPLNERGLDANAIARAVNGRLKGYTDAERHAVSVYIASLMRTTAEAQTKP